MTAIRINTLQASPSRFALRTCNTLRVARDTEKPYPCCARFGFGLKGPADRASGPQESERGALPLPHPRQLPAGVPLKYFPANALRTRQDAICGVGLELWPMGRVYGLDASGAILTRLRGIVR